MRQIVLDTETTGLNVEEGHRLIEIGCLEMINRKLTGQSFHKYVNPGREIEAAAVNIHGITNDYLKDKPLFSAIAQELMDFISGAELIIHNAPFDLSFLNYELLLLGQGWKAINNYCSIIDTLQLARQLHVGQRNSLDALCKRYSIDNSKRELHGALLDASLLAQVYLAMTGGQGSFFDSMGEQQSATVQRNETSILKSIKKHKLTVLKADEEEQEQHKKYLENLKQQGKCIWVDE